MRNLHQGLSHIVEGFSGGGHPVGFVENDRIPSAIHRADTLQHGRVLRGAMHRNHPNCVVRNGQSPLLHGFESDFLEAAAEEPVEIGSPLLNQVGGAHHQGAFHETQPLGFPQPKAGHDRLACSRLVGQQEPQF